MKKLSTSEVAKVLGLWQPNLQRAIAQGKITAPPLTYVGPVKVRLWSAKDIARARKELKAPLKNGRKRKGKKGQHERSGNSSRT